MSDDPFYSPQKRIEELTQRLARHDAHEYEQRAWAAEARVEELTRAVRKALDHLEDTEDALARDGIPFEISAALRDALTATEPAPDPRDAQIATLREELIQARFDILTLKNARWSEAEGSDADWIGGIDAALAATEPAKGSK